MSFEDTLPQFSGVEGGGAGKFGYPVSCDLGFTGERRYMAGTGFPGKEEGFFERHIWNEGMVNFSLKRLAMLPSANFLGN